MKRRRKGKLKRKDSLEWTDQRDRRIERRNKASEEKRGLGMDKVKVQTNIEEKKVQLDACEEKI